MAGLGSSVATSCRLLYSERFFKSKTEYGKRGELSQVSSGKALWDVAIAWHMGNIARGGQQPTMDGMSMVSSDPRWSFNACTFTPLYNILGCSSSLIKVYGGRRREMVYDNVWLRLGSHFR